MGETALCLVVTGSANPPPRKLIHTVNRRRPALRIRVAIGLADACGGTDALAIHDGLPRGTPIADDEAGGQPSFVKPAAHVEAG
jgi:hypothetical protein